MSAFPPMPLDVLAQRLAARGFRLDEDPRGYAIRGDGRSYRFTPTDDGFIQGTQIAYGCQYLGIDPFDLVYGE